MSGTKQITSALCTIHPKKRYEPEDTEKTGPFTYSEKKNKEVYEAVKQFVATRVAPDGWDGEEDSYGWMGVCWETCPKTKGLHIHLAFQFRPKGKMSLAALQGCLKKRFDMAVDTRFPLYSLDLEKPKCIQYYLMKGDQPHDEWMEEGKEGPTWGSGAKYELFGKLRLPTANQGARTDIASLHTLVCEGFPDQAIKRPDNYKHLLTCATYKSYITTIAGHERYVKSLFAHRLPLKREIIKDFRPWQKKLHDIVTKDCEEDRTIYWVCDPVGGGGKSTFVRHLVVNHDGIMLAGKGDNMLYGYSGQKIICCDLPRSDNQDYLNYGAIEKLKDGHFFAGKYESQQYIRDYHAHVVVFSNHMPDTTKFTSDRLKVMCISKQVDNPAANFPGGFDDLGGQFDHGDGCWGEKDWEDEESQRVECDGE